MDVKREIEKIDNINIEAQKNNDINEKFDILINDLMLHARDTLTKKNKNYGEENNKLHNFEAGGEILGKPPAFVAFSYMTKHLVSLRDKIIKNDFSDEDDLLEKCQDIINYVAIIYVIGRITNEKNK